MMSLLIDLMLNTNQAFAETQGAAPGAAPGAGPMPNPLVQFVPLILIFFIFYFLMIRPQQKKQKLQQAFLKDLKRGDMIITNSGIVGTIKTLSDKIVTLEIDNNVCMKVLRSQILESATALKDTNPA